jgi:hypothetical protein
VIVETGKQLIDVSWVVGNKSISELLEMSPEAAFPKVVTI